MKRIVPLVVAVLFAVPWGGALARDICVANAYGDLYVFNNVKLLKGKTTPLVGRIHFGGDSNSPVSGSVTLDSDNLTTRIGVIAYPAGIAFTPFIEYMTGDKSFNAGGAYDNGPLGSEDGTDTWTALDCKLLAPPAIPPVAPAGPAPGRP